MNRLGLLLPLSIVFQLLLTCAPDEVTEGDEVSSSFLLPVIKLQDGAGQVTIELTICGKTYTAVYGGGDKQITVSCRPGEYSVGITFYLDGIGERIVL